MNDLRQIRTLAGLKGTLTMRSHARDTLALVQSILFAVMMVFFSIVFASGIISTFYFLRKHLGNAPDIQVMVLANLLWGIYGLWILVPVFGFRMNESYDISKLLHLPVRRTTMFLANIAGSFSDITIIIPLAALTGITFLFTMSQATLLWNMAVLIVFLVNMILCGQLVVILIYNYLPRVAFYKIALAFGLFAYIIYRAWFTLQAEIGRPIHIFDIEVGEKIYIYFPHGMATAAIYNGYTGHWPAAYVGFFWLLVHTAALGTLTGYLFSRWYAAGNIEGTETADSGRRGRALAEIVASFWARALRKILPLQALEIMRKDHLHLLRSRNFLLYKTIPSVIGPGIVMFAIWYSTSNYKYIQRDEALFGCLIYAAMIFSVFVITAQANLFSGNMFGLEGRGIYSLFTTEVDKRIVLMGKDAFLLSLFLFDAAVFGGFTWLLLSWWVYGLLAFMLQFNLFILLVAAGNFTSPVLPYYTDLERPTVSAQQVILLAIVESVAAAVSILMLLPVAVLFMIPLVLKLYPLLLLCLPLALTYSFLWLWVSIRLAGPVVEHFERLIMERVSES